MTSVDVNTPPLVSVCIPAYNVQRYITQTLEAITSQTCANIEIIVADDGSSDDTAERARLVGDDRIRVVTGPNGGAAHARNTAFQYARGQYIIFFDADDYMAPDFIEDQLKAINGKGDTVALSAWGRFYNDDLLTFSLDEQLQSVEITFADWIKRYWRIAGPMTNPGRVLIPRRLVEEAGLWDESLNLNDDLEFFTRIFLKVEKLVINPFPVLYYRSGINGLSGKKMSEAYGSFYTTLSLSVQRVVAHYAGDKEIARCCANMWQSFIYEVYPQEPEMVKKAQLQVKMLGGSDLKFPAGGFTKWATGILGWKLVKQLKHFFS